MREGTFVVRVNRLILTGILAVSGLFIAAGLDMAFLRRVLDFDVEPDKVWMFWLFVVLICFVLCGGIALQMLWYLVRPPVMLRMDESGLSFGTGFRYTPFTLPWDAVKEAGYGAVVNNATAHSQLNAGAKFTMCDRADVPAQKTTSMGLQYAFRTLHISTLYADKLPKTIVEKGREFLKAFGGAKK